MRFVELGKTKEKIPVLGQGTWGIKSRKSEDFYEQSKEALRRGIELGMTHIDTAEFYGHGVSEKIVGEVVKEYPRDALFITSKLFPMHLTINNMRKAAENSLKRLGLKYFDLYLIHWPSPVVSIKKQMSIMEELHEQGKTRYIGVSNFSVEQFKEAQSYLKTTELVNNQLPANINKPKHMRDSLPYYQENGIIMTAYSPLGHRGLTNIDDLIRAGLERVAKDHDATIYQIAIAWLINHDNVITIPKAFNLEHVEANAVAVDIKLTDEEINLFYPKSQRFQKSEEEHLIQEA